MNRTNMMSSRWYWKNGRIAVNAEIGSPKWLKQMGRIEKRLGDITYKVVKQETLPNKLWVSTVWLGLDHGFTGGKPLIFETMVFTEKRGEEQDMDRYSTLREAIAGHKRMVKKWLKEKK